MAQQLGSFEKVLRVGEGRRTKRLQQQAEYITSLEAEFEQLSDEQVAETGSDPLLTALTAAKSSFRWVNHTYDHPFLGCVQNTTTVPWSCTTNADGSTAWVFASRIASS